jgi:hypothetical protein
MTDEDDRAFEAYSKIAEQISKEDGLIHDRMTWGISINGGLLALLGVGLTLSKDIFTRASTDVIALASVGALLAAITSILVCYHTIKGVDDARKQVYYIRGIYETRWKRKLEDELGLPRPFGSRGLYDDKIIYDPKFIYDPKTIPRWWGDNLFRLIIGLWLVIIVIVAILAAKYGLGGRSSLCSDGLS